MTDQSTGEQLKEEGIAKALEGNEAAELCSSPTLPGTESVGESHNRLVLAAYQHHMT